MAYLKMSIVFALNFQKGKIMKTRHIGTITLLVLLLTTLPWIVHAQNRRAEKEHKQEVIQGKIHEQRFVFKARNVIPMRGRSRNVTTDNYTLKVTSDTVVAYLPYFGRAYVAPMNPSKGGIQFTSTKFQYSKTAAKKGGWNIVIKPDDVREIQRLVLSISSDGYASLQVISTHRDPISFNGIIEEK